MTDHTDRIDGLRAWARGMTTTHAAAELLIAYGPPLLTGPWVEHDPERGRYWFNTDTVTEHSGYLSGGEARVLYLAAAILDDDYHVRLGDALAGLDCRALPLVLNAVRRAAGQEPNEIPDPPSDPWAGSETSM
jgi:hypothetical protein